MSLLERYRANQCAVRDCVEPRSPDAAVCSDHLNTLYRRELARMDDGTYVERRFLPRDFTEPGRSAAA